MTERHTARRPRTLRAVEEHLTTPLSVWATGQLSPSAQLRRGGFVAGSDRDDDRIPPAVAAHAITTYTRLGDLVLDPDCGAGTVVVEAVRSGRQAFGLTTCRRLWTLARASLNATKIAGHPADGSVVEAEPAVLATVRAAGAIGRVGLVLTSLRTAPKRCRDRVAGSGSGRAGAIEVSLSNLAATLAYSAPLLRTGGHLAVVMRPRRHADGSLADLTSPVAAAGQAAGLVLVERCIALTAELRGGRLVPRVSFGERRAAARGVPRALTAHYDVLVFQSAHDIEHASAASAAEPYRATQVVAATSSNRPRARRAA
ncbi:site-specific DNA-methyltransferase [Allokutzneria sp. NRRL B-24872]|uniref:site-specific DNA-methyltransferase n=1 Tax=Allokutzneria sp. NRRL B-24872 TaxID=1137961 RepID=UPI001177876A|nr:site-specific DNA-methyltransferase [Allokutzneria sp. NRRL B-24872]